MRMIIPAITVVVLLCLAARWGLDVSRLDRANEERSRQVRAAAWSAPTSQPATQPAEIDVPAAR